MRHQKLTSWVYKQYYISNDKQHKGATSSPLYFDNLKTKNHTNKTKFKVHRAYYFPVIVCCFFHDNLSCELACVFNPLVSYAEILCHVVPPILWCPVDWWLTHPLMLSSSDLPPCQGQEYGMTPPEFSLVPTLISTTPPIHILWITYTRICD